MSKDFKLLVLISGRGSNLKSLIDNAQDYRVSAVISNNAEAGGLNFARSAGIPCFAFPRSAHGSLREQKEAIFRKAQELAPDLIALAGFMLVVQPEFVQAFHGRMINIHPSLLPAYPGLDTHERVVAAGEKHHGCSVHIVDAGVDTGPIIAQARCALEPADTPATAAAKVLEWEHKIYPWVAGAIARGLVHIREGQVRFDAAARQEAEERGFSLPSVLPLPKS